jgi:hypothetical protein
MIDLLSLCSTHEKSFQSKLTFSNKTSMTELSLLTLNDLKRYWQQLCNSIIMVLAHVSSKKDTAVFMGQTILRMMCLNIHTRWHRIWHESVVNADWMNFLLIIPPAYPGVWAMISCDIKTQVYDVFATQFFSHCVISPSCWILQDNARGGS